jgi:hypothetical protein
VRKADDNENTTAADMINQLKHQNAREALVYARSILERAIREIDTYIGYLDKADHNSKKAQIMNWALHYLTCNILPNVRLDLIANAQATFSEPDRDTCRSN